MSAQTMPEAIEIIKRPFHTTEIEWRVQRSGESGGKVWAIVVPYITARAAHERLDEAFNPWGWRTEFRVMEVPGGTAGVICRLWYQHPESGEWEWKENGAGQTQIEPFKGGLSDSEKRAFEELGGGRYLYSLVDQFAETSSTRSSKTPEYAKTKDGTVFYWGPPLLPEWAIPGVRDAASAASEQITGEPLGIPEQYPEFDALVDSHGGKRGINDLRAVGVVARQHGWTEQRLLEWIASTEIDLRNSPKQSDFAKLKFLIGQEVAAKERHGAGVK